MEIRKKLAFQFIALVAIIMLLSSTAVYISFSESRKEEFYDRLSSKAKLVAQMLIEIDEIDTELLRKIEKNNPLSLPNEKITIYNYKNELLYSSDADTSFHFNVSTINRVRLNQEIRVNRNKLEVVGQFYTGEYDKIVIFVGAVDIFGINKLKRLRLILLFVFLSGLLIVFISGRLFATRALKPISKLVSEVDNIEASELNIKLDEGNGKDEISRLSQTFNRFLKRLDASIKMQKNFIASASHELRTPLTVLSGQLDVILLKERSTEEYKHIINDALEEIRNLTNISNRLLLLAQASTDFDNSNHSSCRIDDIIWKSRQELIKRNKDYNIEVEFSKNIDSENKLIIQGNEILLETAFINLMDNACKYSPDKTVKITIDVNEYNEIVISFKDKGMGISKSDLKNIFQSFFRSKEVLTFKGHGIGLSLVEKIVSYHKGKVVVNSSPGNGSEFITSFTLSP